MNNNDNFKSGFVAILGRPNVGKSTLLNRLIGQKVAIVSQKAQTTRNRIMGIMSADDAQVVFLDTPGIHVPQNMLGEYMMKSVSAATKDVDGIVVVVSAERITGSDRKILEQYSKFKVKKAIVINKDDLLPEKVELLKIIEDVAQYDFDEIVPVSAKGGGGVDGLRALITSWMPAGPKYFPDDMITDMPERFLIAEAVREKALRYLNQEIPHGIGVEIMSIKKQKGLYEIVADIYCEKESHKRIIIGKNGETLGRIGTHAREDIEKLLGKKVNLKLWVRVRERWRDKHSDLNSLGYD